MVNTSLKNLRDRITGAVIWHDDTDDIAELAAVTKRRNDAYIAALRTERAEMGPAIRRAEQRVSKLCDDLKAESREWRHAEIVRERDLVAKWIARSEERVVAIDTELKRVTK